VRPSGDIRRCCGVLVMFFDGYHPSDGGADDLAQC
jgi:hypothetical protein